MMSSPTTVQAGVRPTKAAVEKAALKIREVLGSDRVLSSSEYLDTYSHDESGFGSFPPDFVVRARGAHEISAVLRIASETGVPVTPRGGGTGRVGGALPVCGGIVLSLEQMNRVVEIDTNNFLARVESGVVLKPFQDAVEAAGLFYPPDPSSLESCTLGGNVACNAGGPRALKYGVTANYVLGAEAVLPTGEIIKTGRNTVKGGAGYELHKLLVGSEGTLAVVTGLTLRLVAKPTQVETALVTFADAHAATRAAVGVLKRGVLPRSLELMDRTALTVARKRAPRNIPESAGACLIIELDGFAEDPLLDKIGIAGELCEKEGAQQVLLAQDEAQRRDLWAARRELSPALREAYPCKVSEDVVVPISRVPDFIARAHELGDKAGITIATFGHVGDGNIHVNVLFDEARRPAADAVCWDVLKLAVSLGGTVAGEHGTGIQKIAALRLEQSEALLDIQRRMKRFFDPAGILNPGKVVVGDRAG